MKNMTKSRAVSTFRNRNSAQNSPTFGLYASRYTSLNVSSCSDRFTNRALALRPRPQPRGSEQIPVKTGSVQSRCRLCLLKQASALSCEV